MNTLSAAGWVLVSSVSVALGACVIRTVPADGSQTAANATATTTAAAAATTTAAATATTPAATSTVKPGFARLNPGKFQPAHKTTAMTGSNMFGAQSGSPTALRGDVYWLPQNTTAMPDFSKLTPATTLYAEVLNSPKREFTEGFPGVDPARVEWFGIRFTGQFVVAAAADYTFKVFSKDGAKVYVDNTLVIDNDGVKATAADKSAVVKLSAGQHTLLVEYFKAAKGEAALQLFVTGPDKQEKPWLPAF